MLAQLVEDFFHLKGGEDGFHQHRRLDGAARHADMVLRHAEDLVPQAGLKMAFHLRQIEEGAGSARDLLLGVVKNTSAKSKMPPETRCLSTVTCFSSRCQPRGRICSVAIFSLSLYSLPASF